MADRVLRILLGIHGLGRVRRSPWLVGVLLLVGGGSSLQAAVEITGEVEFHSIIGTAKGKTMTSPFTFVLGNQGYSFTQTIEYISGQRIQVRGGYDGQDCYYVEKLPNGMGKNAELNDIGSVHARSFPKSSELESQLLWLAFVGQKELQNGNKLGQRHPFAFCTLDPDLVNLSVKKLPAGQGLQLQMLGWWKSFLHSEFQVRGTTSFQKQILPTNAVFTIYLPPGEQLEGVSDSSRELESYALRVNALREVPEPATYRPEVIQAMPVQDFRYSIPGRFLAYSVTNQWMTHESPNLKLFLAERKRLGNTPELDAPVEANAGINLLQALILLTTLGGGWAMILARNSAPRTSA